MVKKNCYDAFAHFARQPKRLSSKCIFLTSAMVKTIFDAFETEEKVLLHQHISPDHEIHCDKKGFYQLLKW
jgi:hypothetical protein